MANDVFSLPFDEQAWMKRVFGSEQPLVEPTRHFEAPWGDGERPATVRSIDPQVVRPVEPSQPEPTIPLTLEDEARLRVIRAIDAQGPVAYDL